MRHRGRHADHIILRRLDWEKERVEDVHIDHGRRRYSVDGCRRLGSRLPHPLVRRTVHLWIWGRRRVSNCGEFRGGAGRGVGREPCQAGSDDRSGLYAARMGKLLEYARHSHSARLFWGHGAATDGGRVVHDSPRPVCGGPRHHSRPLGLPVHEARREQGLGGGAPWRRPRTEGRGGGGEGYEAVLGRPAAKLDQALRDLFCLVP